MYYKYNWELLIEQNNRNDRMSLEFSLIGNLDKIIEEKLSDISIPFNLRIFHALNAYILVSFE